MACGLYDIRKSHSWIYACLTMDAENNHCAIWTRKMAMLEVTCIGTARAVDRELALDITYENDVTRSILSPVNQQQHFQVRNLDLGSAHTTNWSWSLVSMP